KCDLSMLGRQRMTERNQFVGAFHRVDGGNVRNGQNVSFCDGQFVDFPDGAWLEADSTTSDRGSSGNGFLGNVDHPDRSAGTNVCKLGAHPPMATILRPGL